MADGGDPGADADLGTFVGRVRGRLPADDEAWVESTSDAIEDLRAELVGAADRLSAVARRLDPGVEGGPFAGDLPHLTAWEQLVVWADGVNADLVELAARRRVSGGDADGRVTALGRLLQSVRAEQVVDELLEAGLLVAPPGTTGWIAFAEHGAWDIEFLGRGGSTIARADVVVAGDPAELRRRLASRPGIDLVYTTSDMAGGMAGDIAGGMAGGGGASGEDGAPGGGGGAGREPITVLPPGGSWPVDVEGVVVVDIGVDATALHRELADLLSEAGSSDSVDALLEAVPVLALLLVGVRATARVATTADRGDDITGGAWEQAKDVVTTAGVSQLVGWASGMNLIKVPATLTFSLGRAAVRDARRTVDLSGRRLARVRHLLAGVADLDR